MNPHFVTRDLCPGCSGHATQQIFSCAYADARLRLALEIFYAHVGRLDYDALLGADYVVQACDDCGLIFQRDVPDDHLLGRLYDEWIDPTKARLRYHHNQPADHFLSLAKEVWITSSLTSPETPRIALDYGCGWGEWSRMTNAFGYACWGTELSRSRREHVVRDGVNVVSDDELPDGLFGLINIDQVLEHLPNPRNCVELLAKKLHPAGVLRLSVPNNLRVRRALRNFDHEICRPRLGGLNAIAPLEHLNAFTTASLLRITSSCGLERRRPRWSTLLGSLGGAKGTRARLKSVLFPPYIRSAYATQLYFGWPASGSMGNPAL